MRFHIICHFSKILIFFFHSQEITDHVKDEINKEESRRPITPSLNMCDMDERDWTSLESSFGSIGECSGNEEIMVGLNSKRENTFPSQKETLIREKHRKNNFDSTRSFASFESSSYL